MNLKNNTLLLVLLLPSSNTLYGASFFSYFFPSQEAALRTAVKKNHKKIGSLFPSIIVILSCKQI
jgi:hypothetical protein